ncbi:hypothetical protein KFE25_009607 [Diacronema lutheri]|uniref:Eukaryotic translation initiation factor 3 30 kDa subunit n=1 Tax=Diacronema lutheri TaxID=2081491 RepID=A0A8J6CHI6_DIALT|nr:hypothetical protein KFE25_009607 [Diacronema lutheri]
MPATGDDDDDWDADDFAPPALDKPAAPPETWSDEEEDVNKAEPAPRASAATAASAAPSDQLRPKQLAKAKLAEREAKEREQEARAKAAAKAAKAAVAFGDDRGLLDGARGAQAGESDGDALAEKLRLRQLQEEADFENAQGIFDMSRAKKALEAPGAETIDAFVARNATDGEALADKVAQKLLQFENTPFYLAMLKSLVKHASASMSADDVKELSTSVQVIANDKLKAERERQKGKKKPTAASKKASIAQSHNPAFDNTDEYGDFGGDDDFM